MLASTSQMNKATKLGLVLNESPFFVDVVSYVVFENPLKNN